MLAMTSTSIWFTMRATGMVALVLLSATMVLGILTAGRLRTRAWPAFAQAELHKWVSVLAVVFLGIHVLSAVLDTYVHVGWPALLVPFASPYRSLWTGLGTVGLDLMAAVAISSALRQRIGPRTWRALHWLAYASWPAAMAHSLGEGTDAAKLWMDVLAGLCVAAVVGAVAWRVAGQRAGARRSARSGARTRAPARAVSPLHAAAPPTPVGIHPPDPAAPPTPVGVHPPGSAPDPAAPDPAAPSTPTRVLERRPS